MKINLVKWAPLAFFTAIAITLGACGQVRKTSAAATSDAYSAEPEDLGGNSTNQAASKRTTSRNGVYHIVTGIPVPCRRTPYGMRMVVNYYSKVSLRYWWGLHSCQDKYVGYAGLPSYYTLVSWGYY